MIPEIKPYIFLNRLVITTYTGAIAYDETFHRGVNIIRGKNSSGKSTISNFIFFALGGDYNNWNSESFKCHEVFAEVEINDAVYTLKRKVTEHLRQPMSIFWGSFTEAKEDSINWKTFSYSQSEDRLSYTNILFNALGFPEVKGGDESNITIHQALRLLYIDQDSPTQNLFKYVYFDHPLTRQAIAELLLGVYDDSLYNDRLSLRKSQKAHDDKKREYENLSKAYVKSGNAISVAGLNKEINKVKDDLNKIQAEITTSKEIDKIRIAKNSSIRVEQIQKELIPTKQGLNDITNEIYQLDLDIIDSRHFIDTLKKRITEIGNSMLTRKTLGQLSLDHCPECLNPLHNHTPEGHCFLCKQSLTDSEEKTHAKRLKQELEIQVKESSDLLKNKENNISNLRGNLSVWKEKTISLQRELDIAISESQSSRDDKIDGLLIQKGGLEKEIALMAMQLNGINLLEQLRAELLDLDSQISALKLSINDKENILENKRNKALHDIKAKAIYILKKDLPRQAEFINAKDLDIDFYGDSMSLNGSFNFSASSNVYLKNAIRFSIFFASLKLEYMRYPKFILCDNMEDKGMEKERSQNFQKLITMISERYKKEGFEHQIIFSTSMIAEELEGTVYCVGDFYNENHKTIRI
jgi:uncharacterized Zn finger protein (UPF0148 family)